MEDFREQVGGLWEQLKPLYQQLHAYVRRHLRLKYGDEVVKAKGPIPAHLLGNMWAQTWGNIADIMLPYPNATSTGNVTASLIKKGYTPLDMFKLSEEFYLSLNLTAMPEMFWEKSIIEKPADGRDLVCHASAWDFSDGENFRIKMCTRVNEEDLYTVHHEMGHVQYFLQYKHLPKNYHGGANEAFHEAVGDVLALSVSTPKHMRAIGLIDELEKGDEQAEMEANINHLFYMALEKIAFLPFAYELDLWRWNVFNETTTIDNYNCDWWKLVHEFQGLEPPTNRTSTEFDIASKYHIVADVPYIRYFVSFVIQFQFHKGLCQAAGQLENNATLNECDIYNSTNAGNLLGSMLQLGSSKPWQDAMEIVTGQREMDASAIREYFAPLEKWLQEENERTGEFIGWEEPSNTCFSTNPSPCESGL
ncbi:angiotensin-converting enzyme-like [Cloeon dipterum]|uniref:angiotensin-converting enzyme-like n=1 Tax=Cloeon dipterum TaxID=197152 RepID=UPI0032203A11